VVLEQDGEVQKDRSCEKSRSDTHSQFGVKQYPTYSENMKANWIGYILCRKCFLKLAVERNIAGNIKVTGRGGKT
jgi:hypothetical protein